MDVQRRALSLYEKGDYDAAANSLEAALVRGDDPMILYNLACYESLAGRGTDAVAHLRRAFELDDSYRALAADDADFDPVRAEVSQL
jgi:tetratricopeptide (TPR) repeat protein